MIQAGNKPERDWIAAHGKDNGDFGCRCFCGSHGLHAAGRRDGRDTTASQIECHVGQLFVLTQAPTVFDRDALSAKHR
jgi:hypothetical protein